MSSRGEAAGAGRWALVLLALAAVGAGAFALSAGGAGAARAWQAYLVNFVFWTGLAAGAALLPAVLTLTGARWAGSLRRQAEAFAAVLPASCVLFAGLWFGKDHLLPPREALSPARRLWLEPTFLFGRDGAALLALTAAGALLVRASRRGSRAAAAPAVVYAILYAVVLSLLGFDWIMSLDPHWVSTLFGAYYFVGSFFSGLAALAVLVGFGAGESGAPRRWSDLGNLVLGFGITTGYLFYVQYLVIWFGNVPAETHYLILRLREPPWAGIAWGLLAGGFLLPVVALLFRRVKARGPTLAAAALPALAGMWLERYLLVAPSLARGVGRAPGGLEYLVTAGFAGAVGLCLLAFLTRFSPDLEPPEADTVPRGDV